MAFEADLEGERGGGEQGEEMLLWYRYGRFGTLCGVGHCGCGFFVEGEWEVGGGDEFLYGF